MTAAIAEHERHAEHQRAGLEDVVVVALGDAVVDDVGVEVRQVRLPIAWMSSRTITSSERPAIGPQVLAQERDHRVASDGAEWWVGSRRRRSRTADRPGRGVGVGGGFGVSLAPDLESATRPLRILGSRGRRCPRGGAAHAVRRGSPLRSCLGEVLPRAPRGRRGGAAPSPGRRSRPASVLRRPRRADPHRHGAVRQAAAPPSG